MTRCAISVLAERPETTAVLLNAASQLAALVGPSEISVIAFHRLVSVPIVAMTDWKFNSNEIAPFAAKERERQTSLGAVYDRWLSKIAPEDASMQWIDIGEDARSSLRECIRNASFIVVPRPAGNDDTDTQETFRAALFDSSHPVLVVPSAPRPSFGRRVGIAWRNDEYALRALFAAIPLLKDAEQIHMFMGIREKQNKVAVTDVLQGRGLPLQIHEIMLNGASLGETILTQARSLRIDMLVMGAYFHSPLREWIFGGVTRYMLAHADLPLLMFH